MGKYANKTSSIMDDLIIIKKKGIVDVEQLYADMKKWFDDKGYEFMESDIKVKTNVPTGAEEEIHCNAWRNENDILRWWYKIKMLIWDSTPVEVVRNGQTVQARKCRIRIEMDAQFEFDYNATWERTPLHRALFAFYRDTVIGRLYKVWGDKMEYEYHELHDLIKRDLDMYASGDQYAHFWK